jgi:hypothetical protein
VDFLFFAIAWLFGGLIGGLVLGQILIILRFGLPTAIRWYRLGWFTTVRPISKYLVSLVILSAILVASTWAVLRFFRSYEAAYYVGVAIAVLYAIGKSGATSDNMVDFVQSNVAYINQAELDGLIQKLGVADKLKPK